jgi:hypothetical protein
MRHVKLKPGADVDQAALQALIEAAYQDVRERARGERPVSPANPQHF